MKIYLSPGHYGKAWYDPGAVSDQYGLVERAIVLRYAAEMALTFEGAGHQTRIGGDTDYGVREQAANHWGADLFIAPHVNAGGGDYGLILYDERSQRGPLLARMIAARMESAAPGPGRRWLAKALRAGDRGWTQLDATAMPALLLEPFFLDHAQHAQYYTAEEHQRELGRLLAISVLDAMDADDG